MADEGVGETKGPEVGGVEWCQGEIRRKNCACITAETAAAKVSLRREIVELCNLIVVLQQTPEHKEQLALAEKAAAQAELAAALAEKAAAQAELERARLTGDPMQIAEAMVGVAEAKVGVAAAEVGVAAAEVGVAAAEVRAGVASAVPLLELAGHGLSIAQDELSRLQQLAFAAAEVELRGRLAQLQLQLGAPERPPTDPHEGLGSSSKNFYEVNLAMQGKWATGIKNHLPVRQAALHCTAYECDAFAKLLSVARGDAPLDPASWTVTAKLAQEMSMSYRKESALEEAVVELLRDYFNENKDTMPRQRGVRGTARGSMDVAQEPSSASALPLVLYEFKTRAGTKVDPCMELDFNYARCAAKAAGQERREDDGSRPALCPAILVQVLGHRMVVYGAVRSIDGFACVDELASASFIDIAGDQFPLRGAARLIAALTKGVESLRTWRELNTLGTAWPALRTLSLNEQLHNVLYTGVLRHKQRVFFATLDGDEEEQVVVKIVRGVYRDDAAAAHRAAAEAGLAPELLYAGPLVLEPGREEAEELGREEAEEPTMSTVPTWSAVVTRRVEGRLPVAGDAERVGAAVRRLHEVGVVHGDLRVPNIIIIRDGSVQFLDFDWAGYQHRPAFYPANINMTHPWAEGVEGGAQILQAHDTALVEQLPMVAEYSVTPSELSEEQRFARLVAASSSQSAGSSSTRGGR